MGKVFVPYNELKTSDLIVDAIYEGGTHKNTLDDPISKLLGTGNMGGFRLRGSIVPPNLYLVVLFSSQEDPEWPDYLDVELGRFIYFGDNKSPGRDLHDTNKKGNIVLRDCFNFLHTYQRQRIPPFFIFTKGPKGRDVIFRGIAVPGGDDLSQTEDLVAVWKALPEGRFQNYKASFTILDIPRVPRDWINDLNHGQLLTVHCPDPWRHWREKGKIVALQAKRSSKVRTKEEQLPSNTLNEQIVRKIFDFFKDNPFGFESCAAKIAQMADPGIVGYELTRPWMDGGRDAIGEYRIGGDHNSILVDFALEAKCYNLGNPVTVKNTSRLISRLRHRQFGILVTTSFVARQAYKEIEEDKHPVVIICAEDMAMILKSKGYASVHLVEEWLKANFQ